MLATIAGIICFTGCWDAVTLPEEDIVDSRFLNDTLSYMLDDGLNISFSSIRKSYSLDDDVNFRIRAENQNSTPYTYSFVNAPPLSKQLIEDEFGSEVLFSRAMGSLQGTDNIAAGDSLVEGGIWGQRSLMFDGSAGFKVFAGWYRLESFFTISKGTASLSNYPLIRWIRINEEGDPLDMLVRRVNRFSDSLQIAIGFRNRISKSSNYQYTPNSSLQLVCTKRQGGDTLFVARQSFGNSRFTMQAFTDSTFFAFSRSLNDSVFNDASGAYDLKATVFFQDRPELVDSTIIFLNN